MERRFELRKREIEEDAKIDKAAFGGATSRLVRYLTPYFRGLPRNETRANAMTFVKGLLSDLDRKNTESIAYRFGQDRRALQRFLGEVRSRLAQQMAKVIGEEDGVLAFDPSGFEKDGKNRRAFRDNGSGDSARSTTGKSARFSRMSRARNMRS